MFNGLALSHTTKPRLVFFQSRYNGSVPEFISRHKDEHVNCLQRWFDVVVISRDCDFKQICDSVEPDIAVFETGVKLHGCRRLNITNARNLDAIPKIALLNADGWSETRAGILSDIDRWGITTLFSIAVTAAEHMPAIADDLFLWPNFIEPSVFCDYRVPKTIPILITGSHDPQYAWRHKVRRLLLSQYPALVCPHGGYVSSPSTRRMMYGEDYARAISASLFVPTCGSIAHEVVRKHFEVPACRTCLITEDSPALRAAGYVDMKNCVFADERNVTDKVAFLFEHRDELDAICEAGHGLVHARHTAATRSQIYQWFVLNRELKPGDRIVQAGPFELPTLVKHSAPARHEHIMSNGRHLRMIEEGNTALALGDYESAAAAFGQSLKYMPMLPEAKFKLGLCSLHCGKAKEGIRLMVSLLRYTLSEYRADEPDPIEWAYFIIALICAGKLRQARIRAKQFPELRHTELDRVRALVRVLYKGAPFEDPLLWEHRKSIHRMPERHSDEWLREVSRLLRACGRIHDVERLAKTTVISATPATAHIQIHRKVVWHRRVTLRRLDNPLLAEALWARTSGLYRRFIRAVEKVFSPSCKPEPIMRMVKPERKICPDENSPTDVCEG